MRINDINKKVRYYFIIVIIKKIRMSDTDITRLENLKTKIESMSKINQLEILNILKQNIGIKINENKSGVYINLSLLPSETMNKILYYLNYILEQELSINTIENQKTEFANEFFTEPQI